MEWFFNSFVPVATLAMLVLCFIWLLAIAATLSKLVKYLGNEAEGVPLMREDGNLLQGPDYVDQEVLRGRGIPHSDGVTQRPGARNWDGIPRSQ